MRLVVAVAAVVPLACPAVAAAHGGRTTPDTWPTAWTWDPLVLLVVGTSAWLYCRGAARLRHRLGAGDKIGRVKLAAFLGSLFIVVVALLSPLDALGEELSSFHMIQHTLLITAAAPLFVCASPGFVLAWGMSEVVHKRGGAPVRAAFRVLNSSLLWRPVFLWSLFAVTIWAWHHPVAYQAALRDPWVHDAQHLSFFVVACLFWRKCLDPIAPRRLSAIGAIPYLFTTSLQTSALGIFLALSRGAWYEEYATRTGPWGLTPLEDQQLAGLIMWMPGCLIFPVVAAALLGLRLSGSGVMTGRKRRPIRAAAFEGG